MAAEVVAGAFLSSFLNVVFERMSKPEVVNWIKGKKLNPQLLGRMKRTLYAAQALLNDAERRQIKEKPVKEWLSDLKDAVYKADDLLDEISTKAATQKNPGNFLSRFPNLDLQHRETEIVDRMEDIIKTLESIVALKGDIGLKEIPMESMSWRTQTTSVGMMSDIYGRDEEREAIVKLLLDDNASDDGEISVIPIVGMGGIGKTTLARIVFNDDRVEQNFSDFKKWVCVGDEFDILKMTKTVLGVETSTNDLDSVQLDLKNKLTKKKFLVVLDDVWSDSYDDWKIFLNPFQYGSEGSKILVTTRHSKVADVVKTTPTTYNLSLLSDEYCWLMFAKHAFRSTKSLDRSDLEKVGRKIVKKCKGLPLAAQTLGGLLKGKEDVQNWKDVLKSEIWEFPENESRILPALGVSYHYLPSHLKRCFVYCSLYPKDYPFNREELVPLWMAEDFLQQSKSTRSILEEIGCKYFNDLVSRSFFQPSNNSYRNTFMMHDLLHDLATFYAGEFYFRASEHRNAAKVDIKTRHFSLDAQWNDPNLILSAACDRAKYIRTFLLYKEDRLSVCPLVLQLNYLRVLSFEQNSFDDVSLPDSIGKLIHLRYLDLSYTPIVTLPESLSNLHNLQTLKLNCCYRLKMLPSGMQDLVNLRHLDITETDCLKEMPRGMSKLKGLHFLSDYIVGKHEENGIKELGALASLRGSLAISSLQNVVNSFEASEARMFDKKHIEVLNLSWSSDADDGDTVDSKTEVAILNQLRPYTDLKVLSIEYYRGTEFPDWLGDSSYRNMTTMKLMGCRNCWRLPSLGQLPSLKDLQISDFDKLVCIGDEFYKNDTSRHQVTKPFPSLETLEFEDMPCWQEWRSESELDAFPQLKKLLIRNCPKLTWDLHSHLPAILELEINGAHKVRMQKLPSSLQSVTILDSQVVEFVWEAMTHTHQSCLRVLRIRNCFSAISFPGDCLPASLQELGISKCKKLEFPMLQPQQQQHESLRSLVIDDSCDSLTSFPLAAFPNLEELNIARCENMKYLEVSQPQQEDDPLPSLSSLSIGRCPSFVSLLSQSRNAALPILCRLAVCGCSNLVSLSTLGLSAPQLEDLDMSSCPEIDSLTDGDEGLPPNLRYLKIFDCKKLVRCLLASSSSSSSTVLHNTHFLTQLNIIDACDSIKSFPKENFLPHSLESLFLHSFPSLEMLDCNGLVHLTSLQDITIVECPKLENMAGERLPPSLKNLSIYECPLLGERFNTKDPQIWPKVSHIPKISTCCPPIELY